MKKRVHGNTGKIHTPETCAKMSAAKMNNTSAVKPLSERLWHNVIKEPRGCWLWQGCCAGGYGRIYIDGRMQYVHRVVFELLAHIIPNGMLLHHKCRVKNCCKPAHLQIMTKSAHNKEHKND